MCGPQLHGNEAVIEGEGLNSACIIWFLSICVAPIKLIALIPSCFEYPSLLGVETYKQNQPALYRCRAVICQISFPWILFRHQRSFVCCHSIITLCTPMFTWRVLFGSSVWKLSRLPVLGMQYILGETRWNELWRHNIIGSSLREEEKLIRWRRSGICPTVLPWLAASRPVLLHMQQTLWWIK